ncbi:TetR/AcrR family transcriptional regulator [Pseudonocardia phyllosphaerae]|uniref:TetR/AcrR family transcriptional regulator n=1 Tax=Pseudonocardia phyllosphaerae TaxID=3390502 RepID=UPI00397C541B
MPATARTPRSSWIEEGLRALATGGPDAVRVEALARALGVTKGGFYGYFTDRTHLLGEMLDAWERRSVDDVIAQVTAESGQPLTRARRAADLTFSPALLPVDLAVRDWSRRDPTVAARLRRVDNARMEFLRDQFRSTIRDPDELEARCLLAFCAAVADDLIAVDHPLRSREEVMDRAARVLFD